MSLRVLEPGLYTLVVDFGRPRSRSLGVPIGGAADRTALALGNALVGNEPNTPALEFSLGGPTLQSEASLACVVFGAPFDVRRNERRIPAGTTFTLSAGDVLHIGGTATGVRAYLCVRHGFQTATVLESRSGLQPLTAGSELPCSPGTTLGRFLGKNAIDDSLLRRFVAPPPETQTLHALPGLQADWFEVNEFFGQEFAVSPSSNRMGLRLQGRSLTMPGRELASEPVSPGAVQVTRDGQCIVLGVDGQTIGGYPKVAQVITADLDLLGQLRPGTRLRFHEVSREQAVERYQAQQARLAEWLLRLRLTAG